MDRSAAGTQQLDAEVRVGCQGPWREALVRGGSPQTPHFELKKISKLLKWHRGKLVAPVHKARSSNNHEQHCAPSRGSLLALTEFLQMCRRYNVQNKNLIFLIPVQRHKVHPPEKRLKEVGLLSLKERRARGSETVLEDLLMPNFYRG